MKIPTIFMRQIRRRVPHASPEPSAHECARLARGHGAAGRVERRRRAGARPPRPARTGRAAQARAALHEPRARRQIWTVDAEATNLRQISFDSQPNTSFPLWAPDGARLLFRIESASYVLDLARGWGAQTPEQVPRPPTPGDFFGAWDSSPDGKKLAGTFAGTGGKGFGYYSFETGKYERVAEVYALPYWLPDSRRIVYAYEGKAYIADAVTKKSREILARPSEQIRSVRVSRDGTLLYYTLHSSENDVWLLNLE